jgi:hypothetical protein
MILRRVLALGLSCTALLRVEAQSSLSGRIQRVDSVVVERTSCLGTCPAYRLTIHSSGLIRFESRNRNDAGRVETDSGGARALTHLVEEVSRVHFFDLPVIEFGKAPYCRVVATDHPSLSVGVFGVPESRTVNYYEGCGGAATNRNVVRDAMSRLRALADSVDAAAGASRWIRPGSCCGGG